MENTVKKENETVKKTMKTAGIDEVSLRQMKKQVFKGISDEKQMARTMLNFMAEFYAEMKKFNENFQSLQRLYTMANIKSIKENLPKLKKSE